MSSNPWNRLRTCKQVLDNSTSRGARGGEGDTRTQVADTTALRALQAKLLGYPSYSSFAIDNQTAGGPDAAADIVSSLIAPANAQLAEELAQVKDHYGLTDVAPEDVKHRLAQYRAEKFDIDADEVAKYFEFDTVLNEGVFRAATGLYGVTFAPRETVSAWHEDVRTFEVTDANERTLGLILLDPYSRDTKRGGAWMGELVTSSRLTGHLPVVTLSLNLAKPGEGRPTLLAPDRAQHPLPRIRPRPSRPVRELDLPVDSRDSCASRLRGIPVPAQ